MPAPPDAIRPDVSIGIPVRNAGPDLRRLLRAIHAQETSRSIEILALDSGSTDGSLEVLAESGVRVIRIPPESFNWGRLRDRLFEESRGAIVVNLSQDAIPAAPNWLEALIAPILRGEAEVSCGSSIPDPERAFRQFQWEKNGYYYFTREMRRFRERHGRGLSFANTAVRRDLWQRLRIDPQATGEDFGFQIKLHAAGIPIAFPADAPVLHHHNYTLKGVFRRCRNEGLALREMGIPYFEWDLIRDLASLPKFAQALREVRRGSLRNAAEWLYPVLRPIAVYTGSRFARRMVWY